MNKVTTDFTMGIADKDLSEELQVRSEQPREVECKCLPSHGSADVPSAQTRGFRTVRNSPRSGAGREDGQTWVLEKRGAKSPEPVGGSAWTGVGSRGWEGVEWDRKSSLSLFFSRGDTVCRLMMGD